jgi:hypothetical protein
MTTIHKKKEGGHVAICPHFPGYINVKSRKERQQKKRKNQVSSQKGLMQTNVAHKVRSPQKNRAYHAVPQKEGEKEEVAQERSIGECAADPGAPGSFTPAGERIVKIPVLLQEVSIQIPLKTRITFPQHMLEIKKGKKRVKVTQCRFIQQPLSSGQISLNPASGKLFLSGFIRKNIQYASPFNRHGGEVHSAIRSLTIDVPFDCVVQINEFLTPPIGPFVNVCEEFDFFVTKRLHRQSTEFFNEPIFCELVRSDITEWSEAINRTELRGGSFEEGTFNEVSEKMVLDLTVKILQKQQIRIHAL